MAPICKSLLFLCPVSGMLAPDGVTHRRMRLGYLLLGKWRRDKLKAFTIISIGVEIQNRLAQGI